MGVFPTSLHWYQVMASDGKQIGPVTIDEHTPDALVVVFYHGDRYGSATRYRLRQLTQVVQLAWFRQEVQ